MRKMSARNITKYLNGTSLNEGKNGTVGISFFQTVLLTLFVITSVILFSALAYYLVKKRALKKMRHHLVPLYHFDPGECDNWEDELLEDSVEGKKIPGLKVPVNVLEVYCAIKGHVKSLFWMLSSALHKADGFNIRNVLDNLNAQSERRTFNDNGFRGN